MITPITPITPKRYEDVSLIIEEEVKKRRGRWHSTRVDFEDAAQEVRLQIFEQFEKWDQSRPFLNWVNTVITNRLINILRDTTTRYSRPCVSCEGDDGAELCRFTPSKMKCSECKMYREWENSHKKNAFNVNFALSAENHIDEVHNIQDDFFDIMGAKDVLVEALKKELSEREFKIFQLLYIERLDEESAAKAMGFKTTEKHKKAGYRSIKNYRDLIIGRAKMIIARGELL